MRRRTLAAVAAAFVMSAAAPGGAQAISLPAPADWINYIVRSDGSSAIGLGAYPSGVTVSVLRCAPGCETPLGTSDAGDGVAVPADTAPGEVFYVSRTDRLFATTVPWQGPLKATAAPVLTGEARVGAAVTAAPGSWSGGFGREQSWLQLQACRDAAGSGCVNIGGGYSGGVTCDASATIPQRFTGWYLRAAEQRISSIVARTLALPLSPETETAIQPSAVTSFSTAIGPIAAGPRPVGKPCTPPPARAAEVRIRARAGREQGELTVARVRCAETCGVTAELSRGARSATVELTAPFGRWTRVALSPRVARRLGAGRLSLRVEVRDGRPAGTPAAGRVSLARRLLTPRR